LSLSIWTRWPGFLRPTSRPADAARAQLLVIRFRPTDHWRQATLHQPPPASPGGPDMITTYVKIDAKVARKPST
jgi:hypothetical protein